MNKRNGLFIGINDYPGTNNDLAGCVNDAIDMGDLAHRHGYTTIETLLDSGATRDAILEGIERLVATTGWGDRGLVHYSGHGTNVADLGGDESDGRDEAWVPYDWSNGLVRDDDLYDLFSKKRYGARLTLISDSCYSGDISRLMARAELSYRPRYMAPHLIGYPSAAHRSARSTMPGRQSKVLTLTGCAENEVSWDAYFDGRPNGALTRAAIDQFSPGITYSSWHKRILATMAHDQTPQLVPSTLASRYWKVLG